MKTLIKTIDRYEKQEGGCDFIINLRPDGKWKPIHEKKYHAQVTNGIIHHHASLTSEEFIDAVKENNNYTLRRRKMGTNSVSNIQTIDTIQASSINLSSVGNMLMVNTDHDAYYYLLTNNQYKKMPPIPLPILSRSKNIKHFNAPNSNGIIDLYDDYESLISNHSTFFKDAESENYYRGVIMITSAYEMNDGSIIYHNNIISENLEYYKDNTIVYSQYPQWSIDILDEDRKSDPFLVKWSTKQNGFDDRYYALNNFASKLDIGVYFTEQETENIQNLSDIIKSINIYAHYIPSCVDYYKDKDDHKKMYRYKDPVTHEFMIPEKHKNTEGFEKTTVFRKIHSINVSELKEGTNTFTLNLTNYNIKEPLPVDNNSHHDIISTQKPYVYNNAAHYYGVKTKFSPGVSNQFIANIDHKLYNYSEDVSKMIFQGVHVSLKFVTKIETSNEDILVEKNVYTRLYTKQGKQYFFIEPFFSYPDSRAKKTYIYTPQYQLIDTINLTPHDTLNVAYNYLAEDNQFKTALNKVRVIEFKYQNNHDTIELNNILTEHNRLQVSEINNPLFFPARYSYSINRSEKIMACTSVSEEVGSGQRGQFPLFIFSDSQIYLVQQGSTSLYEKIFPIHRIGIKGNNTASFDSNVIFASHDGIFAMDTRGGIQNISKIISGETIPLDDTIEEKIKNRKFDNFAENSIFLYDRKNRELLISNPDLKFSYVFNKAAQSWYIRNEYFTQSVVIQSKNYFFRESKLYSEEEDKSKPMPYYVQTNPLYFGTYSHKKISRSILRGRTKTDTSIEFSIFAETNYNYKKVTSSTKKNNSEKVELSTPRIPSSSKSFIFVSKGKLRPESEILFFESMISKTLDSKIR